MNRNERKANASRPTAGRTRKVFSLEDITETGTLLAEWAETHGEDASVSPRLSAGDLDARWDQAEAAGEETPGGSTPTPDQDVVDEIGEAVGVMYEDEEPLRVGEKEHERDEHRWELDPASAEDFSTHHFEPGHPAERIRHMRRRNQYK